MCVIYVSCVFVLVFSCFRIFFLHFRVVLQPICGRAYLSVCDICLCGVLLFLLFFVFQFGRECLLSLYVHVCDISVLFVACLFKLKTCSNFSSSFLVCAGGANPGAGGEDNPEHSRRHSSPSDRVPDEGSRVPRPGITTTCTDGRVPTEKSPLIKTVY